MSIPTSRSWLLAVLLPWSVVAVARAQSDAEAPSYLPLIARHFQELAATGTDVYGPETTPMWMSVIDTRTGLPPEKPHTAKRVYRKIGAPQGTTLYWDQPMVVAAYELSRITGRSEFRESADRYIQAFLEHCVDERGLFEWGNHEYYDAFKDDTVQFYGGWHELRPITPAWDLFWLHDREKCAAYIRTMARRHVYDRETGGFNRHDDGERGHAFIESGGILVESLAWLYAKTGEPELLQQALSIARYSHSHRGEQTGLVKNEPDFGRWDSKVCTTEIGVWAQSLLRASQYTGNEELADMARSGIEAYLRYGFDGKSKKYYGQLAVEDGQPIVPEEAGYWPGKYANPWSTAQWPTHDYPMAVAEACVTMAEQSDDPLFVEAIDRWAKMVADTTPAHQGTGAYAEHYGRCIHFLTRAGRVLENKRLLTQAQDLAQAAVARLRDDRLFQGYPETHLYESVDGVGYLFLALMFLETEEELDLHGFGF